MLWRSCIGPPSQPKLALSLPIKGPSFCRLTVYGGSAAGGSENQTTAPAARGNAPLSPPAAVLPPKGETTHYILCVADAPSKCVRCAPRRGKFALLSTSELISISRHKGAKTSPSGEGAVGRRGAFLSPVRAVGLFSSGRSPVVWFSLHCCHKPKLTPLPSTHSPTTKWAGRWWRQPPKGAPPHAAYNTLL